jgi:hypothetical protein
MAYTYSKLATVTVGSGGSSSIDFIAIPQNYTDLLVKFSQRADSASASVYLEFNSSSSNLSNRRLYADGSGAYSFSGTDIVFYGNRSTWTASTFSNVEIYVPNYASANYKSVSIDGVTENNATLAEMSLTAGLWSNNAAITSLKLLAASGNFVQYSTATLYGIKAEV